MKRWIVVLIGALSWGYCGGVEAADVRVTGEVITKEFVGFGANVSPWVYCAPNWPGEVNEENVEVFEREVVELGVQHVRIFIKPEWWDTEKERERGESVERVCRLMERAGATVNLTLWGGVKDKGEEMGKRTADVVARLILEKKITCVRYVTLQNEPNGFGMDQKVYVALYRAFDAEMKRLGVRDRVKIIGGDLLSTKQEEWFGMLARDLSGVLDGYAVHMYSDYWDVGHMEKRLAEVVPIVAGLPESGRKPLYLMEFGVRGHRRDAHEEPGKFEDGREMYEVPVAGTLLAYQMIEAVNRGYVATCQWDLVDVMYDRDHMHYGVIGEPKEGWREKPGYGLLRMFTHAAGAGWSVVRVAGDGGMRSVAAMRKGGEWAVFVVNRGKEAGEGEVGGLPAGGTFREKVWNGDGKGRVAEGEDVKVDGAGKVSVSVPGLGVVALTTMR